MTVANYQANPLYVSYDYLEEGDKEKLRDSALELLHFMRMQGFELTKVKPKTLSHSATSTSQQKFALQFFEIFCGFLDPTLDQNVDFLLRVLFPTATSYLQKYVGYFMPTTDVQESSTTASNEEKLSIIKYDFSIP